MAPVTAWGSHALFELTSRSDLIARGRVTRAESFWSADGRRIESKTTVRLTHYLKGEADREILIYTIGGFIWEENLGMLHPHEATFEIGEEVIVFAQADGQGFRLVNGAAGKVTIDGQRILNHFGTPQGTLRSLMDSIEKSLSGSQLDRSDINQSAAKTIQGGLSAFAAPYIFASGHRKWIRSDGVVPFRVHINTAQAGRNDGSGPEFLDAIVSAAETWNGVSKADFVFQYAGRTSSTATAYNGFNEVLFVSKGREERGAAAQVWYRRDLTIVEADIWINDDFDWNAAGVLEPQELDLQSVMLHEFGHWLVLGHLANNNTVMYPKLSAGIIKRSLHEDDKNGISFIYPCHTYDCDSADE